MAGISTLRVTSVGPDETLVVYRIVRGASVSEPEVLDAFRSNYERDRPPRGVEASLALIQMGLSMFRRPSQAENTARRWPVIGDHIARLTLESERGFAFAPTGPNGHLTVWGRPVQLLEAVVDIYPIER